VLGELGNFFGVKLLALFEFEVQTVLQHELIEKGVSLVAVGLHIFEQVEAFVEEFIRLALVDTDCRLVVVSGGSGGDGWLAN
jgi:hypothetical protein